MEEKLTFGDYLILSGYKCRFVGNDTLGNRIFWDEDRKRIVFGVSEEEHTQYEKKLAYAKLSPFKKLFNKNLTLSNKTIVI